MKRFFAILIACVLLIQPAAAFAEEDDMEQYRSGDPWLCLALDGTVTEETPVDLKDNFALYVSRDFYLNAELPEEYGRTGTLFDVAINVNSQIADLFTENAAVETEDAKLARSLYDLQMDWDVRNQNGVQPLKDMIAPLDGISTVDELNAYYLNTPIRDLLPAVFSSYATFDVVDPEIVVGAAEPAGLFLDSAEYGDRPTELGEMKRSAFTTLIGGMLARLGYSEEEAEKMTEDAFAFEKLIAPTVYTDDEQRQPDYIQKILNYYSREELMELQGKLPAAEFAEKIYGEQDTWLVTAPAYYEFMQDAYIDDNVEMIKNWMICHAAAGYAEVLDRDCYDFYNATMSEMKGTTVLPDEIIASSNVAALLPWETAHLFCDTYFTQEDKNKISAIVDDVIEVYKEMLKNEDFLSEETSSAAIRKLDNMVVHSLYPDDWENYTYKNLEFKTAEEGGSFMDALNAITEASVLKEVEELSRPRDRQRWSDNIVPTTFNCANSPMDNSINILAAFCQGDLYNPDMKYEEMLGTIGMVIAHEITHSFDGTGGQFDETGAFSSWWNEEDFEVFTEKLEKLAAYYDGMTAWEGMPFNGSIMTGEACADMGALKCMLQMAAGKEDFDYDAFFRSYANLWAEKNNLFGVLSNLQNEHPLSYIRVNSVLQQYDEFLDCYGIGEGDSMYLAPEDRVLIW